MTPCSKGAPRWALAGMGWEWDGEDHQAGCCPSLWGLVEASLPRGSSTVGSSRLEVFSWATVL